MRPRARSEAAPQACPPSSRPSHYDADLSTCQPQVIRSGFQRQLEPFADQAKALAAELLGQRPAAQAPPSTRP